MLLEDKSDMESKFKEYSRILTSESHFPIVERINNQTILISNKEQLVGRIYELSSFIRKKIMVIKNDNGESIAYRIIEL